MTELTLSQRTQELPLQHPRAFLLLAALIWWGLYQSLIPASEAIVSALPVDRESHLGGALQFFFYDTPKVLMLLTGIVFVMGMVNSYFTPERTRALLAGRTEGVANVMAASLGVVTPFCSCSAVPLFIGFVQAGVPLGVTFSFLIAAPMVNEVALALLFGMFGWKIAVLYLGLGLAVAIVCGWIIGRLKMEACLEDWVRDMPRVKATAEDVRMSLSERVGAGFASVREIVGRVWPYILAGIAIGAGIHGYVPQELMASFMGKEAWWAVPLAVIIGVPMYTNAAGVIPIVQALRVVRTQDAVARQVRDRACDAAVVKVLFDTPCAPALPLLSSGRSGAGGGTQDHADSYANNTLARVSKPEHVRMRQ